jgi:hypothetical protein
MIMFLSPVKHVLEARRHGSVGVRNLQYYSILCHILWH